MSWPAASQELLKMGIAVTQTPPFCVPPDRKRHIQVAVQLTQVPFVGQHQAVSPSIILVHQPSIAAAAGAACCSSSVGAAAGAHWRVGQQAHSGAEEEVTLRLVRLAGCRE